MKRSLIIILITLFLGEVNAQHNNQKVKSTYDRSSLSWLVINNQNLTDFNILVDKMKTLNEVDKYDINPLNSFLVQTDNPTSIDDSELAGKLSGEQFGIQILKYWFSMKDDGTMTPNLFFDRGLYNAKDEDILKAQALKRGLDYVKDYGENLIDRSHIIVVRIDNIIKVEENTGMDQLKSLLGQGKFRFFKHNYRGYIATITAFLYRINFNQEQKDYLYNNCWIYPEDNSEVRKQKIELFNNMRVGFTLIKKETFVTKRLKEVQKFPLNIFFRKPPYEKLMAKLSSKIQEETMIKLTRGYEEFEVKVPIYNVKPVIAKVGKKEGLRPDDRYFVYEYSIDESSNQKVAIKTAVVRAKRVVDNRHVATGNMEKSKFVQNWGAKLEPGQLMIEKNDFGYSGSFGYEFGKVSGLYWKAEVLMGRAFRFPISNLYLTISGAYETKSFSAFGVDYKDQKMLRYTYAFSYPFYVGHNLNLKPFGGLCAEGLRNQNNVASGVKSSGWILGMDVSYGFQSYLDLYGGATYYGFYDHEGWEDFYKDRSGLAFRLGVRFSF